MLDSVHDDKNMAIHQCRMLIASPHHMAVRVIEESYDDEADRSFSKIIYKEQKNKDEVKAKKPLPQKKQGTATPVKKKKKKKDEFSRNLIIMVLSVGGIGLGLLALVAVLIAKLG